MSPLHGFEDMPPLDLSKLEGAAGDWGDEGPPPFSEPGEVVTDEELEHVPTPSPSAAAAGVNAQVAQWSVCQLPSCSTFAGARRARAVAREIDLGVRELGGLAGALSEERVLDGLFLGPLGEDRARAAALLHVAPAERADDADPEDASAREDGNDRVPTLDLGAPLELELAEVAPYASASRAIERLALANAPDASTRSEGGRSAPGGIGGSRRSPRRRC